MVNDIVYATVKAVEKLFMDICLKHKQFLNYVANNLSNKTVYSQSAHISELRALYEDTKLEMKRLHSYSTYTNNSYFDN